MRNSQFRDMENSKAWMDLYSGCINQYFIPIRDRIWQHILSECDVTLIISCTCTELQLWFCRRHVSRYLGYRYSKFGVRYSLHWMWILVNFMRLLRHLTWEQQLYLSLTVMLKNPLFITFNNMVQYTVGVLRIISTQHIYCRGM